MSQKEQCGCSKTELIFIAGKMMNNFGWSPVNICLQRSHGHSEPTGRVGR